MLAGRPLWVREGLAQVFAGEAVDVPPPAGACPDDEEMRGAAGADQMREVYARAGSLRRARAGGGTVVAWRREVTA